MKKILALGLLVIFGSILGEWTMPGNRDAEAQAVRTLKFGTLYSEGQEIFESNKFFTNEIEKRTQGKIKFKIFPGSSLVPTTQAISATHSGVLDTSFVPPSYEQSLWPITDITSLFGAPKLNYEEWRTVHDQIREITNKSIKSNLVVLGMSSTLNYLLFSRKPLTGKHQDFMGMLMRSAGGSFDAAVKAMGAAPVLIPAPEAYMAVQKGTIDGAMTIYSRYVEGKLYEVGPHCVIFPIGFFMIGGDYAINKKVWNSFPADIQKIFLEVGTEVVGFQNDRAKASDKKIVAEILPKLGVKPILMSEEENRILLQKIRPVWDEYIKKLGKPAEEIAQILGVK